MDLKENKKRERPSLFIPEIFSLMFFMYFHMCWIISHLHYIETWRQLTTQQYYLTGKSLPLIDWVSSNVSVRVNSICRPSVGEKQNNTFRTQWPIITGSWSGPGIMRTQSSSSGPHECVDGKVVKELDKESNVYYPTSCRES